MVERMNGRDARFEREEPLHPAHGDRVARHAARDERDEPTSDDRLEEEEGIVDLAHGVGPETSLLHHVL